MIVSRWMAQMQCVFTNSKWINNLKLNSRYISFPFVFQHISLFCLKGWFINEMEFESFLPTNVTVNPLAAREPQMRCIRWSKLKSLVTVKMMCFKINGWVSTNIWASIFVLIIMCKSYCRSFNISWRGRQLQHYYFSNWRACSPQQYNRVSLSGFKIPQGFYDYRV